MQEPIVHENQVIQDWQFPVQVLSRQTNRESQGCEFHWHKPVEFYYVAEGGVHLCCNGEDAWLYEGDIGIVNCREPHKSLEFQNHSRHYCIQADVSLLQSGPWDICGERYVAPIENAGYIFPHFVRQNREIGLQLQRIVTEYEARRIGYELEIKAALASIFVSLLRGEELRLRSPANLSSYHRENDYVTWLLQTIADRYDTELTLPALAKGLGISEAHMCRVFKRHTGVSILTYMHQLRCYRAAGLLRGGYTVTATAYEVGYNDANYFSRIFRRIMGEAPSRFGRGGRD